MLSVIVCTWNRSALLRQCLAHMAETLEHGDISWELILVDNNSTDNTRSVVASYQDVLPIKYVFEPTQGLAHARNRGLMESSGELLVFTDDDVFVDSKWLRAYAELAEKLPDDVAFCGGSIVPRFPEGSDPVVIHCHAQVASGFCGVTVSSVKEIRGNADDLPRGANFALVRARLGDLQFNRELGVAGTSLVGSEEEDLFERLMAKGWKGLWWPDAKVEHFIEPERLTIRYLGKFFFDRGRTLVIRGRAPFKKTVLGIPYWLYLECGGFALRTAQYMVLLNKGQFLRFFVRLSYRLGSAYEFRIAYKNKSRI